jgi:hypothetical protein
MVLVIEENEHEAALLTSAMLAYLQNAAPAEPPLFILGARALGDAPELTRRLRRRHAIVAIVPEVPAAARERALAAGVQAVHTRPSSWTEYRDLVREIVQRRGAQPDT